MAFPTLAGGRSLTGFDSVAGAGRPPAPVSAAGPLSLGVPTGRTGTSIAGESPTTGGRFTVGGSPVAGDW